MGTLATLQLVTCLFQQAFVTAPGFLHSRIETEFRMLPHLLRLLGQGWGDETRGQGANVGLCTIISLPNLYLAYGKYF